MMGAFVLLTGPVVAHAETMEEVQERLQEATAAYDKAQERIERIEELIVKNEARIAEIETELPEQREAAASSIRTVYKMQQDVHGLLELILSSESFFDFLESIQYLDIIQARSTQTIDELVELNDELDERRVQLADAHNQATAERQAAQDAIDDAVAAREELERIAAEEAAREEAERQAALEEAARRAAEQETFTNASGNQVAYEDPGDITQQTDSSQQAKPTETESQGDNSQSSGEQGGNQSSGDNQGGNGSGSQGGNEGDSQSAAQGSSQGSTSEVTYDQRTIFVYVWTKRIDAYLKGTPLSGYGYAFAEAAWDYGVDPRYSPAISYVESSCGAYCFRSHNAWGWGSSSWSDWDTAIRAHVRGLAAGYGYTLTYAGAQKYCPPGDAWYSAVATQMSRIWATDQI